MKPGPMIGLLLGIGLLASPVIGFVRGEASAGDPIVLVLGLVGLFMVIVNIICIAKGTDNLLAPAQTAPAAATTVTVVQTPPKEKEEEPEEQKIRCRFCKKSYSAEYNGCPYCKKK